MKKHLMNNSSRFLTSSVQLLFPLSIGANELFNTYGRAGSHDRMCWLARPYVLARTTVSVDKGERISKISLRIVEP